MEYLTERPEWVTFYPTFNSSFYIEEAGYFDERPEIHTSVTQLTVMLSLPLLLIYSVWFILLLPLVFFGWGSLYIHLPIRTGIQDCQSASWGFNYFDNKIWIYIGGGGNFDGGRKWKTISMPWALDWVRTSTLMKNNQMHNETRNNKLSWDKNHEYSYYWLQENKWIETHPYIDKYDNTIVNATISVVEREWRPRWFRWTSIFAKKEKTIDVEFDKEIGKDKGSYKGGVIGTGYIMNPNETPIECLKRMQDESKY